ncbi:MAG: hypothetical protein M3Z97_07420 [Candidatus Dormibacteraeota bacterium]|nr:hypothetical protein [Candidatus Dormibacteraeota bacterium]
MINRLQGLVLAFFVSAVATFLAILVLAPGVYGAALRLPPGTGLAPKVAFTFALSLFLLLLALGVVRRWRWTFWLIVVAFVAGGALRIPASLLELAGKLPETGPAWYVALQAGIGAVQLAIGLAMLAGWRQGGPWAMPRRPR